MPDARASHPMGKAGTSGASRASSSAERLIHAGNLTVLEISSVSVPAFVPHHPDHDYLFVVCHLDRAGDAACLLNHRLAALFARLLFVFQVAHLTLRA
jgi:hypothetical protein